MRRVPLARRNLFQDRRRAALAVSGIAVALVLVLVLNGVFAGAMRQATAYLRNVPAEVLISQRGVRTMHMSRSALPEDTATKAAGVPGVEWAEPIRLTSTTVRSGAARQLTYVFGYDTQTGRGGPWDMVRGRAPRSGEAVIDEVAAAELGVDVGNSVEVLGRQFRVTGLSRGGTSITNTMVFIPAADFTAVRGPAVSYVLVHPSADVDSEALARRLTAALPDTTVQTRSEFIREETRIVRDMSADLMQIMTVTAFLIALAVIALTLFTSTLAKLREYAVIKALGASTWRLARTVLAQAAWSSALALALALVVSLLIGVVVAASTPNIRLAIEAGDVTRVGIAAFALGAIGALLPLRRIAGVDPATAFKE